MTVVCSFCGKSEGNVQNLVAGKPPGSATDSPSAYICNECVELAHELTTQSTTGDVTSDEAKPSWQRFMYDGAAFEWVFGFPSKVGRLLVVREVATGRTVGLVWPNDTEPSTEIAIRTLDQMRDHLA